MTPLVVNPGRIVLTDAILYFQVISPPQKKPYMHVLAIKINYLISAIQQRRGLPSHKGQDQLHQADIPEEVWMFQKPFSFKKIYFMGKLLRFFFFQIPAASARSRDRLPGLAGTQERAAVAHLPGKNWRTDNNFPYFSNNFFRRSTVQRRGRSCTTSLSRPRPWSWRRRTRPT